MKQRRFPRAVGTEDQRDRFDGNSLLFFAEGFKIRDSDGFESHDLDLGEYCGRIRLLRMKTHLAFRRIVRGDELLDGVEDDLELLVVFSVFRFKGLDLLGEQAVGIHQAAELHKCAHDGDVHLYGAG